MGERLLRAAVESSADLVRITGIHDPAPTTAQRFGAFAMIADSAAAVIDAADCVYIASPPATHVAYAELALARGKAVFCEKPLAVDLAEARAFVTKRRYSRIALNFPMASYPAVTTLRNWIDDGVIGRPNRLEIEVAFATWPRSWQSEAAGWLDRPEQGGFTREVLSHFLFLTRRLCGPLQLEARQATFPIPGRSERAVAAHLRAGDLPVRLSGAVGTTLLDDHNTWTLWGDLGAIRLREWSMAERLVGGNWETDPAALPIDRLRPLVLRRQLEGAVRMTRGEPHHLATLDEALEVMEMAEAIRGEPE